MRSVSPDWIVLSRSVHHWSGFLKVGVIGQMIAKRRESRASRARSKTSIPGSHGRTGDFIMESSVASSRLVGRACHFANCAGSVPPLPWDPL